MNWYFVALSLLLATLSLAQEDVVTSAPTSPCDPSRCLEKAREAEGCSANFDGSCMCDSSLGFIYTLRSCLISEESDCIEADYQTAFSEIQSTCTPYQEIGKSLCDDCFTSGVNDLGCLDGLDFDCLCNPNLEDFLSDFASCAKEISSGTFTCPQKSISIRSTFLESDCSPILAKKAKPEGCAICQNAVATELDCTGQADFSCICTKEGHLQSLSSCIQSKCLPADQTVARNIYVSACDSISAGLIPDITLDGVSRETEIPRPEVSEEDTDEESIGPDTTTVIGIVAGSVAGLSAMLVGGYFIFRKRSRNKEIISIKEPPKLPPRRNGPLETINPSPLNYKQDGVYEMWGSHQFSGRPNNYTPDSELGVPYNNKAFQYKKGQNHEIGSSQHLEYLEIGPSK